LSVAESEIAKLKSALEKKSGCFDKNHDSLIRKEAELRVKLTQETSLREELERTLAEFKKRVKKLESANKQEDLNALQDKLNHKEAELSARTAERNEAHVALITLTQERNQAQSNLD
jgi:hypothetical protein